MSDENALHNTPAVGDDGFLKVDPAAESPPVSEPPKKRGPGRPRKDGSTLNAEVPGAAKPSSAKPQKRGPKMSSDQLAVLSRQLVGLHIMAASMSGIGELQITPDEGTILASGISAVAEEYGLSLDGKTGAALQLFGACAMIYAPRFIHFQSRVRAARNNVVDVPSNPV